MTEALKPCPAGHRALLYCTIDEQWSACCDSDDCVGWNLDGFWPTKSEAAEAWNTRAESAEVERLRAENKMLRAELIEAVDDIESWGAYAPSYFAEKWDLTGNLERHRKVLAQLPEES